MNPIFSIWTRPTETLKYILSEKTIGYGFIIIALYSLSTGMVTSANTGLFSGLPLAGILAITISTTFIGSLIGWFIGAGMYTWVGKWLGGRGKFADMVRVFPAYSILMIWLAPMNMALVVMYGTKLFDTPESQFAVTNLPIGVYFLTNLVTLGIGIYGIVVMSKGIGLVHDFSAMRGFGVLMIMTGILIVLGIILVAIFGVFIFSLFMV